MVAYDLSHLTQAEDQRVIGPIQDDEALFVYALVRGMMTMLALHDTNLHYPPLGLQQGPYVDQDGHHGFAHQVVERHMVNLFKAWGYDVLSLHTTPERHDDGFPFRHGMTVCKKFKALAV
jgi:hypothetical protein